MNPILVQQMAQYRMDSLDREADANRRVAIVNSANAASPAIRQRIGQAEGRLRLVLRGAAA